MEQDALDRTFSTSIQDLFLQARRIVRPFQLMKNIVEGSLDICKAVLQGVCHSLVPILIPSQLKLGMTTYPVRNPPYNGDLTQFCYSIHPHRSKFGVLGVYIKVRIKYIFHECNVSFVLYSANPNLSVKFKALCNVVLKFIITIERYIIH